MPPFPVYHILSKTASSQRIIWCSLASGSSKLFVARLVVSNRKQHEEKPSARCVKPSRKDSAMKIFLFLPKTTRTKKHCLPGPVGSPLAGEYSQRRCLPSNGSLGGGRLVSVLHSNDLCSRELRQPAAIQRREECSKGGRKGAEEV